MFLYSCTSLRPLDIQIAKKEQFSLPDRIQSMAILNRAITPIFTNLTSDSLEHLLLVKRLAIDTVFCDSMAVDTTIQAVAKALYESGRFDVVVPLQMNIIRKDTQSLNASLPITFINEICRDFNTDAVLVR